MAKQLNVNLNFTADATQVQKTLQNLQANLTQIASITPVNGVKLSQDLQIAKQSAKDLQQHLINAFNVKTGNLDLGKLDASLKASGQNLGTLSANLIKAGTTGQQAFLNIQRSISNASVQINQANGLLTQFWTTLKNTARWQISSSILHGLMSGLQSAWSYATDLDKSLNNIRIVTGYSSEKMAEFANYANKAAKALSTTTTEYTNASLIYYQQGLSDQEVLERTDITVKMANVTGQSAQEVSDQLTAIWNNFDDGSKSLEYYADAITALGAATASSTDEISQGLEKFAAVAETVGLSYEYATAALATVTATTRQSADVVGTAFKTLFARLSDLQLGKTLDDGTTLGSYSENLAKIGVNIKDASGQLKGMDTILRETAVKWDNLDKAQQVALAKGVAGIRQYTQFIALMDNWDFMEENLNTIKTSSGALQDQANIYADSWEAATKKVKSAAEGIYRQLFPTEELTDVAEGFAVFLEGIEGLVRGLGGLEGILLLIANLVITTFQHQIGDSINNAISKVSSLSAIGHTVKSSFSGIAQSTLNVSKNLGDVANNAGNVKNQADLVTQGMSQSLQKSREIAIETAKLGPSFQTYAANLLEVNNTQALIEQSSKHLTAQDKERLAILQQQALAANEQVLASQQAMEAEQQRHDLLLSQSGENIENYDRYSIYESQGENDYPGLNGQLSFESGVMATKEVEQGARQVFNAFRQVSDENKSIEASLVSQGHQMLVVLQNEEDLVTMNKAAKATYSDMVQLSIRLNTIQNSAFDNEADRLPVLKQTVKEMANQNPILKQLLQNYGILDNKGEVIVNNAEDLEKSIKRATNAAKSFTRVTGESQAGTDKIASSALSIEQSINKNNTALENFRNKISQVTATFSNALSNAMSLGHAISSIASGFSTVAMGINSVVNFIETLNDEDASFMSKLTSGAMAATMGISALMTVLSGISNIIKGVQAATDLKTVSDLAAAAAEKIKAGATEDSVEAELADLLVTKLGIKQDEAAAKAKKLVQMSQAGETKGTIKDTIANWANVASQAAKYWWIALIIIGVALLAAGIYALVTAESEEEKQLKKSTEAAQAASEEYDKVKEKAEAIKNSFKDYNTIVDKLKACKKGTKEWREALQEVQEATEKIMLDYPNLVNQYSDLFYRDKETGTLMMDQDVMEQVISDQDNAVQAASLNKSFSYARMEKDKAAVKVDESFDATDDLDGYAKVKLKSLTEKQLQELSGLSGNDLADKILEITGSTLSDFAEGYYNDDGTKIVTQDDLDKARAALGSLDTAIGDYTDATTAASKQMQIAAELLMDQKVPDEKAEVKVTAAADLTAKEDKYYKAYLGLMTDVDNDSGEYAKLLGITQKQYDLGISKTSGSGKGDNFAYDKILEDLQKYVDAGFGRWTDNGIQGTDDGRYLVFSDSDGKEWKKSADYIAKKLASSRVLAEINDSVSAGKDLLKTIETNIGKLDNKANDDAEVEAINSFIAYKNFDSLSVGNFDQVYKAVAKMKGDANELTKEDAGWYLDKILGNGDDGKLSKETAKKYGFETGEEMINAFYNALSNGKSMFNSLDIFDEIQGFDKISLSAASNLETAFEKINLGPMGAVVGERFISGLNDMLGDLKGEKRISALEELANIDWSSYDAVNQASTIMAKYGQVIDTTSEKWDNFTNVMRKAMLAVPDFSKIKNDLIEVNKILKDLSFGSVIDEENYQTLIKWSGAWDKFFILQADGTRKFIGDQKSMQKATRDRIRFERSEMLKRQQESEKIKATGVDAIFEDSEVEKHAGGDGKDNKFTFKKDENGKTRKATTTLLGLKNEEGNQKYIVDEGTGEVFLRNGDGGRGEKVSNAQASSEVLAVSRATMAENLINTDSENYSEEVHQALLNQGYSQEEINAAIEAAKNGNDETLKAMWAGLESLLTQDYSLLGSEYEEMLASTATSLADLNNLALGGEVSNETYEKALTGLASSYASCTDELEEYNKALELYEEGSEEAKAAQKKLLKALLDADWRKLTKSVKGYIDEVKELTDVEEIAKKYESMAQAMNEAWGTNVSGAFVQQNYDLVEEWANATGDRATELGLELQSKAVLATVKAGEIIEGSNLAIELDIDGDGQLEQFASRFDAMKAIIEANPITIDAYGKADMTNLIAALMDADFTAQEVANYLASIGQTDVVIGGIANNPNFPEPRELDLTDPKDQETYKQWFTAAKSSEAKIQVKSASVPSKGVADMSRYRGKGGGGGGGDKKPAEKKKKTDVVDRYKEVTDSLDKNADAMERANKAADGLYGVTRIKNMETVNKLLQKEIGLLDKKSKEANEYLKEDRQAVADAVANSKKAIEEVNDKLAEEFDIQFTFDKDGNISNYTKEMTELYELYNKTVDKANADGNVDEDEQKQLDAIDKAISDIQSAIDQYDETKSLFYLELDQQKIDKFNEILSNNFEKINAKLELDIEFNEQDLAWIEYQLSKIEDDVYSTAEAMALMWNSTGTGSQYSEYVQNLKSYQTNIIELETAYEDGTISQASYVEGMKAASEGILDNLSSILELDKAMKEYYSNTLSMAQDEISKYTDLMDNAASVLEHYSSLMELFGKATDYTSMGKILEAQAQVSKDAYDSSAAAYKMFNDQALAAKQTYEDALANPNYTGDIDMLKEQWLTAQSVADEAYEDMLSDAETFAENMRAVLENALAGFAQELEDALTGDFRSFDALSTELERASSLQEEFLTTTNKIYETNKMMRTAQKEIDKTTNQMAKRKLKEFINETAAMQEQGQLSQYELEIQQAKYDLLLAEIALKEAQNAKSTVRLQRDSEGNFGYVYTADQSAIDDAQQKFEDSQNALYNKGLEGANDYAQKYIETMSEMNDALAEANQKYLDGEYKDVDEYNDAIDRIREYYYKQLENYSHLYQIAIGTDSRVTQDAWTKAFGGMTTETETWKTKTEEYIGKSGEAFTKFDQVLKPVKDSLSVSAKSIKDITTESGKLKDLLMDPTKGVIKALTDELNAVKAVTDAYAAQKSTIDGLITSYEGLAQQAGNAARGAAYDPTAIAPGSSVQVTGTTSWVTDEQKSADNSETGPDQYNTNYTVLRWDEGKKNVLISDGAGNHGWVPIESISAFDTGGYTGSWGSYGKMAMVHEKELILNSKDTENFLASMEFLHKILEIIDLQAMSSQLGGILTSPSLNHNNTSVIEQDVHIEATFPNAVNHSEIEEAFNNLINISSQYANRK